MAASLQWRVVGQLVDQSPITKNEADILYKKVKTRKQDIVSSKWREHYKKQANAKRFIEKIWTMEAKHQKPLIIKIEGSIHIEFQVTEESVIGYIYSYPGVIDVAPRFILSGTPTKYERFGTGDFEWTSDLVDFALFLWEGYNKLILAQKLLEA
jgi:hypothetical protein